MKKTLLFALFTPSVLLAQGVSIGAARWLTSPGTSEYRIGVDGFVMGPVYFRPNFQLARTSGDSRAGWGGFGSDLILRTTRDARPYLIGGGGLGLGRPDSLQGLGPAIGLWGGAGAELMTLGPIGLQAEAMYTWRARMGITSISLGIRAGMKIGRGGGGSGGGSGGGVTRPARAVPGPAPADEEVLRRATGSDPSERPASVSSAPASPGASVVATALGAMGTPYRWGGASENGFDCSGLIYYSYAQQGIELPRRSAEQARAGYEVGRDERQLVAGDILTFASTGRNGDVTHVGLYIGGGRFIHSAGAGVQVGVLSPNDAGGRWWYERWVGARRLVG